MSQYPNAPGDPGYSPTPSPGYPPAVPPGKGMGVASMVLGIIALVFSIWGYFAILSIALSIVGLVLGVVARKKNIDEGFPPGMATAGIVCSIISLALSVLVFVACVACVACAGTMSL